MRGIQHRVQRYVDLRITQSSVGQKIMNWIHRLPGSEFIVSDGDGSFPRTFQYLPSLDVRDYSSSSTTRVTTPYAANWVID